MTDWLTKTEAAAYLKVSVRQLSRLKMPRTCLGRSPRYSREALDEHLQLMSWTPPSKKGSPARLPRLKISSSYPPVTSAEEHISQLRERARRR
jgi:hypothetical protein